MIRDKTVLLYSGGLDSYCIRLLAKPDVCLYVRVGVASSIIEYERVRHAFRTFDEETHTLIFDELSMFELSNKIVPARNCHLAMLGLNYGNIVMLGATAGDTTHDKDNAWAVMMTSLMRYVMQRGKQPPVLDDLRRLSITVPYIDTTKRELVTAVLNKRLATVEEIMTKSYSCYSGDMRGMPEECGVCRSCIRKYVAVRAATKRDDIHTFFKNDPRQSLRELYTYSFSIGRCEQELLDIAEVMEMDGALKR